MSSSYPTALDSLTNPASSDTLDNPSHADQHINANDAIEAIQAALGVNLNNLPKGILAYDEVTTSQTGISAETTITGLSVAPTLVANRKLRVSSWMRLGGSTALSAIIRIKKGGVDLAVTREPVPGSGANNQSCAYIEFIFTSTAETPTFTVTLQASTGTVDTVAATTNPVTLLVEDMGAA